jgi:hypothetical protein
MILEEAKWCNAPDDEAGISIPLAGRARKRTVNFAMSVLDLCAGLLYFLASLAVGSMQKRIRKEVDNRTVTIGDYTVLINHLPKVWPASTYHAVQPAMGTGDAAKCTGCLASSCWRVGRGCSVSGLIIYNVFCSPSQSPSQISLSVWKRPQSLVSPDGILV